MNNRPQLFKKFNNVSTRKKLLLSYIIVVCMPVLLVGIILTISLRNMALSNAVNEAENNVERVKKRVADLMKSPIDISQKLYADKELEVLVLNKYDSAWDTVNAYWNYKEFDELKRVYKEIEDIKLFSPADDLLENWYVMKATEQIKDLLWYKKAVNGRGKMQWEYIHIPESQEDQKFLSLTRLIMDGWGKQVGVLVVTINNSTLYSILGQESFETIMVDHSDIVIGAKDTDLVGKSVKELQIPVAGYWGKGIEEGVYKGKRSKFIIDSFAIPEGSGDLRIVSIFPVSTITADARKTSFIGILIMGISLLVSFFLIWIFSYGLSKRIGNISSDMHRVASGDLDFISEIDGTDEIGQLSRDLNMMVNSIKRLMNEVCQAQDQKNQLLIKQKEIKLRMLSNQVNPHFLFNTLETVRMRAHNRGQEDIAQVVKLMGKILRRSLEAGNEPVALDIEIDLVRSYLDIQKFRFGERISYKIHIEDGLQNYKILPFTIQPIVENALVHGLESRIEGGEISITCSRDRNTLCISIADNGQGMNVNRYKYIIDTLNDMEEPVGKSIGLRNVHQRLKLFYGEKYGIRIASTLNEGTSVDIVLPGEEDCCAQDFDCR